MLHFVHLPFVLSLTFVNYIKAGDQTQEFIF